MNSYTEKDLMNVGAVVGYAGGLVFTLNAYNPEKQSVGETVIVGSLITLLSCWGGALVGSSLHHKQGRIICGAVALIGLSALAKKAYYNFHNSS
jgi:hypothetical protein